MLHARAFAGIVCIFVNISSVNLSCGFDAFEGYSMFQIHRELWGPRFRRVLIHCTFQIRLMMLHAMAFSGGVKTKFVQGIFVSISSVNLSKASIVFKCKSRSLVLVEAF